MTHSELDSIATRLAAVCKSFLQKHGGMPNYYGTFVRGDKDQIMVMTPELEEEKWITIRRLGDSLRNRLCEVAGPDVVWTISAVAEPEGWGAYEIRVEVSQRPAIIRLT